MSVVIVHDEMGVFIGVGLGLAFFSMLDTGGQTECATFEHEIEARAFVESWDEQNDPNNYRYVTVATNAHHVGIELLVKAGLADMIGKLLEETSTAGMA